jgi:hypothetical protein
VAGDLTERREYRTGGSLASLKTAVAPLERLVNAARDHGVTVAGVTGEHDGADSTAELRSMLGWSWLLKSGEVNREAGVAVHAIEGRPLREGVEEALHALRLDETERNLLLAHGELRTLRRNGRHGFSYYALGHDHHATIQPFRRGSRALAAYPGHLFSYWDGDGKAWRVFFIEGTISPDGHVEVRAIPLAELGAPETRRLFIDSVHAGKGSGILTFENAPELHYFEERGFKARVEDDVRGSVLVRRVAEIEYATRAELMRIVQTVLREHANDVFAWPANGNGRRDRADYGHRLASERQFHVYLPKVFKKDSTTQ